VWKAVDSNSGRVVAIKFYNRRGGLDWSHMSREVEKLQYLFSDRYVVQLLDVGWDANPPYYVMEYMEYGSLEDRLQAGNLSISEAVKTIRQIAMGLVHAHDRGILHCDLKPENILLDEEGQPRLADFGQSRLKHEHAPAVGTLFYMAPEQAELSMVPDVRWDVYALGAILYRMVTGKLPYLTSKASESLASQDTIDKRLKTYRTLLQTSALPLEHYQVSGVDPALREIIDRCLAINPKHRYPNVQSVLHALALRESKRAQRPLVTLGIAGPGIAVLLLSVVSILLFNSTLNRAQVLLLERTEESNQFAAKSVAAQFQKEIERRWEALAREAENDSLVDYLQQDADSADLRETPEEISQWLNERFKHWNAQFDEQTEASYCYVLDRNGRLRGITPTGQNLVGDYFGYRDYFHGQGQQLSDKGPVPEVIQQRYRSNVFRSQPDERLAVSLSVPIRNPQNSGEVLGVLVMESELGHFAKFQANRSQLAVLIDTRP
ncbi:MAG: protein kinase, partial [Planctomycetaceae bacterium]|nr:protein kinase [Planctomycetaceae bacterium]